MANATATLTGVLPGDVLYCLWQGNRLRLRAARRPAAGELLISEMARTQDGQRYQAGPFQPGREEDLRDWKAYGRIDDERRFVSLNPSAPPPPAPPVQQLALAFFSGQAHV